MRHHGFPLPAIVAGILALVSPVFGQPADAPPRPKIGLALAGGSALGLAHIGVLQWMEEHRVPIDFIAGTSMGGLVGGTYAAGLSPAEQRTPEQQALVAESDALIDELQSADVIALGLPLYNFGIPSTLKAYFDHIARAGVTFSYTASGPEGLVKGKRVVVFAARGGLYQGQPHDTQTPYVRNFLGFLGMTDVQFVYAEGLAMGPEAEQKALEAGKNRRDAIYAAYDRFYKGDIAKEFARGSQEMGGLHTEQDLANWKVQIEEPVMTDYKGIQVYKLTAWTQGPALLQALNILETVDVKSMGYNSARYIHALHPGCALD